MSGASAHKSRTQQQARRLAADLAKGRMPASTVDLEDYLDRFPDDVFVALDGFVEQVASSGADDAIALGYLYLIQGQLERVRFRSERGYEDATRLIAADPSATGPVQVLGGPASWCVAAGPPQFENGPQRCLLSLYAVRSSVSRWWDDPDRHAAGLNPPHL